MTTIKELLQSLLESSRDRLKNPVVSAFIFSWVVINWRILGILLLSDKVIEDKIKYIEDCYTDYYLNLWIPLGVAVFYILLLPYIMLMFDSLLRKAITLRRQILTSQRLEEIQDKQEIAAEEWQLEKIKQGSQDIESLKDKISELELLVKEKDNLIGTISRKIDDTENQADSTEEKTKQSAQQTIKGKAKIKAVDKPNTTTTTSPTVERKELTDYPTMKEIVIRDLPKTEREWILIYALYVSELGTKSLRREDIMRMYEESNRKTDSRLANLSNNINNMIKSGQFKFLNDDEMLLTSSGIEMAKEILNR
ncbi:MAG: hypothetical protein ACKO96_21910 [Flammeovirgaceae bacterium]